VVAIATTRYCDGVGAFLCFFVINCNEKNSKEKTTRELVFLIFRTVKPLSGLGSYLVEDQRLFS